MLEQNFMPSLCVHVVTRADVVCELLDATCRMQRFGMNTYLYAPKDDYKHRLDWRELYTEEQAGMCLCVSAGAN